MRVIRVISVWFLLAAVGLSGQDNASGTDATMEQLTPELQENLIDPVTVEKNATFAGGESLKFKLGWGIFSVAKASLQTIPDTYDNKEALRITLSARTNGFADAIYKVRNVNTSWIADDVSRSFEYASDQNEGGRRRDSRACFDTEANTAQYSNKVNGENREPISVVPGTFDPLGIVFLARALDFDVGDKIVIPTSNGKEFFYTIIHVKDKVTKNFRFGKREAFVLEPDIKDIGGVFKRSDDGKIRFFMSADEEKLPLRMESEVAVGKFWAELVEVEDPEQMESVAVSEIE